MSLWLLRTIVEKWLETHSGYSKMLWLAPSMYQCADISFVLLIIKISTIQLITSQYCYRNEFHFLKCLPEKNMDTLYSQLQLLWPLLYVNTLFYATKFTGRSYFLFCYVSLLHPSNATSTVWNLLLSPICNAVTEVHCYAFLYLLLVIKSLNLNAQKLFAAIVIDISLFMHTLLLFLTVKKPNRWQLNF